MNKDTFRGFICGILCLALVMNVNPLFTEASDSNTTAYDRLITAIGKLETKLDNLTTAANNSGGSGNSTYGTFGGHKVVKAGYAPDHATTTISGNGIVRIIYGIGTNDFAYSGHCSVNADNTGARNIVYYIVSVDGYGYANGSSTRDFYCIICEIPFTTKVDIIMENASIYYTVIQ